MKILSLLVYLFTIVSWSQTDSGKILLDKDCSLELHRELFNPKGHKLEYKENFLIAIDNVPLFGSEGEIPKYKLTKAVLKIGAKSYNLQIDDMYNPWMATELDKTLFTIMHDGEDSHLLKGKFSDGNGNYAAEWLIVGKASIRSILIKDQIIIDSYFRY